MLGSNLVSSALVSGAFNASAHKRKCARCQESECNQGRGMTWTIQHSLSRATLSWKCFIVSPAVLLTGIPKRCSSASLKRVECPCNMSSRSSVSKPCRAVAKPWLNRYQSRPSHSTSLGLYHNDMPAHRAPMEQSACQTQTPCQASV